MNATNLFAPISTANRITGNSRVRRPRAPAQLAPGSSYDYGRGETWPEDAPGTPTATQADGSAYQMPGAFLRRTMPEAAPAGEAPMLGYGLHGLPTPEALMQVYAAGADAQYVPQPSAAQGETYPPAGGLTPRTAKAARHDLPAWYTAPRSSEPIAAAPGMWEISPYEDATPQSGYRYPAAPPRVSVPAAPPPRTQPHTVERTAPASAPEAQVAFDALFDTTDYPAIHAPKPRAGAAEEAVTRRYPPMGRPQAMPAHRPSGAQVAPAAPDAAAMTARYAPVNAPVAAPEPTAPGYAPWPGSAPAAPDAAAMTARYAPVSAHLAMADAQPESGARMPAPRSATRRASVAEAVATEPGAGEAFEIPAAFPGEDVGTAAESLPPQHPAAATQANRTRRAARSAQRAPAAAVAEPAETHAPEGLGRVRELPAQDAHPVDVWAAMGWKTEAPQPFETTSVWRVSELNMFERDAFGEPLDPIKNPPQSLGIGDAYPDRVAVGSEPYPGGYFAPVPGESYPMADAQAYRAAEGYPMADAPGYRTAENYPYPPPQTGEPVAVAAQEPPHQGRPSKGRRRSLAMTVKTMGPWRVALITGISIGLLFCAIEGYKMVRSLVANEQENQDYLAEYYALSGGNATQGASGVELLPPGVTYTPTSTPVPVHTATPKPLIDQNDPLIGVVDAGGNATFQAALPTNTPVTRTKQTGYAGNALLSVSDAFTELRAGNPDVVGRITIEGVLDEVVVQRNNTFYLNHNARGLLSDVGAVFVDESCVLRTPPENLLLRAQATVEGKLFAPLKQFASGAEFLTSHGIITLETIYETAQYVVFAVIRAESVANADGYFNYAGYPSFQSDAQMEAYVQGAKQASIYNISVGVQPGDRLLTLATVPEGGDTVSLVLLCRMLRSGETPTHIQQQ